MVNRSTGHPASRWAQNGDVALHYLDTDGLDSPDERLPLVFMHGFGEEALDHVDLMEQLAPRRVVLPDLRGRGPSDTPETGYTLDDHVADLDAILTAAIPPGRFHLASYSRGTGYALAWAAQHPERIASLTIAEYRAEHIAPPEGAAEAIAARERFGRPITERVSLDTARKVFSAAVTIRFDHVLRDIDGPVMVLRGTKRSSLVSEEALAAITSARPDTTVATYDDCGHDLWRPDPNRVADRLRSFLEGAEGSPATN